MDDRDLIERQLGRPPRGEARVAVRCPHGRPAVIEQAAYLDDGSPFPTTHYLTCPAAVARLSALESGGGVARCERLLEADAGARAEYDAGRELQRRLRRPAARMRDGGAAIGLGVGGTRRDGAVKCLHAHAALALAEPGYAFGRRILEEAQPLFPADACCTR